MKYGYCKYILIELNVHDTYKSSTYDDEILYICRTRRYTPMVYIMEGQYIERQEPIAENTHTSPVRRSFRQFI